MYRDVGPAVYPRVVIIDGLLLVCAGRDPPFGGSSLRSAEGRRVLIIGAGDAGDMIVREMRKGGGYLPVGFIDDDPSKLGRTIHGVKVLGPRSELPRVVAATKARRGSGRHSERITRDGRSFVHLLEGFKRPDYDASEPAELVTGRCGVKQIRPLAIEDLLPRSQVALNTEAAAGSSRANVCSSRVPAGRLAPSCVDRSRALEPSDLILYERYENSLYAIANDLADRAVVARGAHRHRRRDRRGARAVGLR